MGINGLSKVIGDYAPSAIKENEMKTYFGKILDSLRNWGEVAEPEKC